MEVRNKIIQAAKEKFFQFGYSRVRVDEIADSIGISKKTVYNHFLGKEELLFKLIEKIKNDFEEEIKTIKNDEALSYQDMVKKALELMGAWIGRIEVFTLDLKKHQPKAYALLQAYRKNTVINNCYSILNRGVEAGFLKKDSKIYLALFMFLVSSVKALDTDYHKSLPDEMVRSFPQDPTERLRAILSVIYEGIRK